MKGRSIPMKWMTIAGLIFFLGAAQEQRELAVAPGQELRLRLEAGGNVEVSGWDRNAVAVSYNVGGRDGADCRVEITKIGSGVEITTEYVGRRNNRQTNIQFHVQVPRRFDITIDSRGGGLRVSDVEGTFRGETMGGPLTLENVAGTARLSTLGGEIRLTDSEIDGSLETNGGEVLFRNVVGDIEGSSLGGNIRYMNVIRRNGEFASPPRTGGVDVSGGTVQISTMGGDIDVDDAPEGVDVHTMGGEIDIRNAVRFVKAKTLGGDIRVDAVDGWVEATTYGGDIEVTVIGSGGDVTLTSLSGDVTLAVPSTFSMALDLQIAYTRNSKQNYRIISDFDLQVQETDRWDYEQGTPRKYIYGKGAVAGGMNRVTIETVNGNIYLRRR